MANTHKKNIAIIGGGPASMMLASCLDSNLYSITIYEKNAALGRKFLVAGKGGFNLTHSENSSDFISRYYPIEFIRPYLTHFSNTDLRNWLSKIGIETYIGTSKRVFPIKGIKPIDVLKAIEKEVIKNHVKILYNYTWCGWENNRIKFLNHTTEISELADIVVFALGGGSWKITGSNEEWLNTFKEKNIHVKPFLPSNCAYKINWNKESLKKIEGQVLKNVEFKSGNVTKKGEAVITEFGIEGSGVYPLAREIRNQLAANKETMIYVDFKPELSLETLHIRFENKGKDSIKDVLEKKIKLTSTQIELIKSITTKAEYHNIELLPKIIKSFPLRIVSTAPLDEAISSVGGISLEEIDLSFQIKKMPTHYCIGEMLDWDAPTGGYLLQACFSMGHYLATHLNSLNP